MFLSHCPTYSGLPNINYQSPRFCPKKNPHDYYTPVSFAEMGGKKLKLWIRNELLYKKLPAVLNREGRKARHPCRWVDNHRLWTKSNRKDRGTLRKNPLERISAGCPKLEFHAHTHLSAWAEMKEWWRTERQWEWGGGQRVHLYAGWRKAVTQGLQPDFLT